MFPEYLNNISRFLKFFLIFATFHVSYKDVSYIKNVVYMDFNFKNSRFNYMIADSFTLSQLLYCLCLV